MRVTLLSLLLTAAALSSAQAQDEPPLGVWSGPAPDAPLGVSSEGDSHQDAPPPADAPVDEAERDPVTPSTERTPSARSAEQGAADEAIRDGIDEPSPAEVEGEGSLEEQDADLDLGPAAARWTPERVAAWTTFIASFGVAIAGGILLAAGVDDRNAVENAPDGTEWERVAGARDRAPILTGVGAALLGLGAAGAAVGAGLLAAFGAEGTWLEVSALPAGVTVRGRF